MTNLRNVVTTPNPMNTDAGGRLRVANMSHVFEARFNYGENMNLFRPYVEGGGTTTHDPSRGGFELATGTTAGDRARRVSARYLPQPLGRSLVLQMTGKFSQGATGTVSRIGWYDEADGLFFERDASGISLVLRSSVSGSVVEQRIPQSQWNVDTLDGSGRSKQTLDLSKLQIITFASAFAGAGGFFAGFTIGGQPVTVHHFQCSNVSVDPLLRPVALPAQYEIVNTGSSVGDSLFCDGVSVFADGPYKTKESDTRKYYVDSEGSAISLSTTEWTPLISVKLDDLRNGLKFRGHLFVEEFNVLVNGTSPIMWQTVVNPTLSGGPLTWSTPSTAPGSSLVVTRDVTGYSGGQPIGAGFFGGGSSNQAQSGSNVKTGDEIPLLSAVPYGPNNIVTFGAKAMENGVSVFFSTTYYEVDD